MGIATTTAAPRLVDLPAAEASAGPAAIIDAPALDPASAAADPASGAAVPASGAAAADPASASTAPAAPRPAPGRPASLDGGRVGRLALAAAVGASSIVNFGFHGVATRMLSVDDYGALAAVLALMTAAAVPIGAAQTALTRAAAHVHALGERPSGRRLLVQAFPVAVAIVGLVAMAAPLAGSALRLRSYAPILVTGVWLGVVCVEAVPRALLIAVGRNQPVAGALLLGAALRIAAVLALAPVAGLNAAVGASVVGELAALGLLVMTVRRRGLVERGGVASRVTWPDAGRALSAQVSLWLLAALAVLLGRRTLSPDQAGAFAAMATAAGSCVFLPQAVATIVFPRFVADGSLQLLLRATALAGGVGVACAAMLCLDPATLFGVMFGPAYAPDRVTLALLCLHFVALGCLTVLAQYLVARRHAGVTAIWVALGAAAAIGATNGAAPHGLAVSLLGPSLVVTVIVGVRAVLARNSARHRCDATVPSAPVGSTLARAADLDLTVVVPSYNGGGLLRPCVESICATLDATLGATGRTYEVLVMIDGSTDGSDRTVEGVHPCVVVDRVDANGGKGETLRRGFLRARGARIGFIDGDGDIESAVLVSLVDALDRSGAWVAVASKNLPGSNVHVTFLRRVMSGIYRLLVHWLFDLEISDTQCGCKLFRREYLAATIGLTSERGYALDLELLSVGTRLGMRQATEVPVILARQTSASSTVSRGAVLRMIGDTVRIRRRLPQNRWDALSMSALAPVGSDLSSPVTP